MKNTPSSISVIIPTVNAASELDLALTSLTENSDNSLEIVVVVDPDQRTGKTDKTVLKVCERHNIKPIVNTENCGPYGNWNKGAEQAQGDMLIFATDDQYFAPHWDTELLSVWKPRRLVAGRLVEPGILPVWRTNIEKDFGTTAEEFRHQEFNEWCRTQKNKGFVADGFFIPMLISRQDFDTLGHYPVKGQFGTSEAVSNDINFVENAVKKGYVFGTAQGSYSYHFQASSWKKKTVMPRIAAVILTKNEEKDLPACLASLGWVTDIFIIDSGSTDKTREIAKKSRSKVVTHTFANFSIQRNFALDQVSVYDWVLMIDADETVPVELATELQSFARDIYLDGVSIPRRNYIFGRFIEHSDWYPDERMIFFRPRAVRYHGDVHERAIFTKGKGNTATARHALMHHNYDTVTEFVQKNLIDYPRQYADELEKQKISFLASDLVVKPAAEFMRRFFLREGYKDGMYGLVLAFLMGAQTLLAYIFLWEKQGKQPDLTIDETNKIFAALRAKSAELSYWLTTVSIDTTKGATKLLHRAKRKALKVMKGL